ncbi:MAG: RNB domain-containing ribonuclease [Treponema sp.]|jgi:exoribonuclease-2|nr:RNB domain-containing ribonuclease [Treponema sp.]
MMISEKSLAVYKNRPALVTAAGEKIHITVSSGESFRVREKDIDLLHPGPVADIAAVEGFAGEGTDIRGAWELLESTEVSLKDLAELVYGVFSPQSAWAAYRLLRDGLYFAGTIAAIHPRTLAEVSAEERKRADRRQGEEEREAFLARVKGGNLNLPEDGRFFQDVEALAYGRSDKSRTLRELGNSETPEEAHRLLLRAGVWTPLVNPHPARFGLSLQSAREDPGPPPEEERQDMTGLRAYAIDNAYSDDPDDAVFIEGNTMYVHVADPAAAILPGSPTDLEARGRGATLYLPEGPSRMITGAALPAYALGFTPVSPALTFKISLQEDGAIVETEIIPSLVKVTRLTYRTVDQILTGAAGSGEDQMFYDDLAALEKAAARNRKRREAVGAVSIDLPEVHISLSDGRVSIEPDDPFRSREIVRECMLLAGEGAARWASRQGAAGWLPFPYVCQEAGDLPQNPLPGMAGSYQLRRCMRPRTLSVRPGRHWGLGLEDYTQVTSPLRRYIDLLAHQQIRSILGAGLYRECSPLDEDELLLALAAGEAGALASVQAERVSRAHWTAVYLADKRDSQWDGVALEKKGNCTVVMIPALGLETQVPFRGDMEPNTTVKLVLKSVNIPQAEAVFVIM